MTSKLLFIIPADLQAVLLLLVFGGLLLVRAEYLHRKRQFLLDNGVEATATIIRLEDNPYTEPRTYYPVLRFQTANQQTITTVYPNSKRRHAFKVGTQVAVRFLPHKPEELLVLSEFGFEMWVCRFLGFGASLLGILTLFFYIIL